MKQNYVGLLDSVDIYVVSSTIHFHMLSIGATQRYFKDKTINIFAEIRFILAENGSLKHSAK